MQKVAYRLGDDGVYIIHNYNRAPAFSSFLSGIAGKWGIPAWAYYVNRGQALCTFGVQDKDHSLMEFHSARLHQHRCAHEGFRTFIVIHTPNQRMLYEPFRTAGGPGISNSMEVHPHELLLKEKNEQLGLKITVCYATVPNQPFAALARKVTISNFSGKAIECDIIDGFPRIVPYGEEFSLLKLLPFVTEGYLQVKDRQAGTPFINMRARSSDDWQTVIDQAGHFFMAIDEAGRLLRAIVDQELVFGEIGDFEKPYAALRENWKPEAEQGEVCQTCCAFVHRRAAIDAGNEICIDALYGQAHSREQLPEIAKLLTPGRLNEFRQSNRQLINSIRQRCFVYGGCLPLHNYLQQTYLDNVLRGGLPVTLSSDKKEGNIIHLYGRKHGDLERDYNMFHLEPAFFSQGDGAFRDVNQNRRHDVWFNPAVGRVNIRTFFNLLQLDGYNPLLVHGACWRIDRPADVLEKIASVHGAAAAETLRATLENTFTPGAVFKKLAAAGIEISDRQKLIDQLMENAEREIAAGFGQGYWCDHWIYNFDHIDSYLAIYPEKLRELLLEDVAYTYYDTAVRVLPRSARHVLLANGKVTQVDSLEEDPVKQKLIAERNRAENQVRIDKGRGTVYRCCLTQKIICLFANKMATIAPSGVGLEMEGGRPGWNDSINGLPGIFGSSVSEIIHLNRAVRFLRDALSGINQQEPCTIHLPVEIDSFWNKVVAAATEWTKNRNDFIYWQTCNDVKEAYRTQIHSGLDGSECELTAEKLIHDLDIVEKRLAGSLEKSHDSATGLPATYCRHNPVAWREIQGAAGRHPLGRCVEITAFEHHFLPPFLEAPAHALNTGLAAGKEARELYNAVRNGPLYDRELGMYIVCDSLANEGPEVGRLWAWAPGWFENENVFLHLEHKYLLGCLHAGLYEQFFDDLKNCALPFQPPERYGRNPYENASFIMSSRQPKKHYRGRGFQPRSSGTTAEVLEMHLRMSFGRQPFALANGQLTLSFNPVLPPWMFSESASTIARINQDGEEWNETLPDNAYAALFLGHTLLVYRNPNRKPTYATPETKPARPQSYVLHFASGEETTVDGMIICGPPAEAVRARQVSRIDCLLD